MKAKYLRESKGISLTKDKLYEVIDYESGFIRIIDNTDEDYLYDPDDFEIIKNNENKA